MNRWRRAATPAGYLLTACVLVGLVWKAGPTRLVATFAGVSPSLFATAVALAVGGWALMTLKWQFVLHALGISAPFNRLFAFNLTAQVWNLLLPAQIGGEIYRGGRLVSRSAPMLKVASAAVLDRGTTVVATALLGLVGLALPGNQIADARVLAGLATVVIAPFAGFALLRYPPTRRGIMRLAGIALPREGTRTLDSAVSWVVARPAPVAVLLVLAVGCQMVFVIDWTVLARSFGAVVGVPRIAWLLAAASLLPYFIPLPGAAVAVQQGVFVTLLVLTGVPTARASAVAFSGLIVALVLGMLGAFLDGIAAVSQRRGRPSSPKWAMLAKERVHDGGTP